MSTAASPARGRVRSTRTVRQKLMAVVLATTGTALLLAAAALFVYELRVERTAFADEMRAHAAVLALSVAPAVAFEDRATAERHLGALRARPAVVAAVLYVDGAAWAQYLAPGAAPPPPRLVPPLPPLRVDGERVIVLEPVRQGDELLGYAWVEARHALLARLGTFVAILVLVSAFALGVAALLSRRLQQAITEPLEAMAGVAREVVARRDYSLRARRQSDDEVGLLVEAFNTMLEEIEARTAALYASEQLYRAIGEALDYGVWIDDAAGRTLYLSDSFLRLTGVAQAEFATGGRGRVLHPDDQPGAAAAWAESLRTGTPFYRELRVRAADGSWRPILSHGVPIRDADGRIVRWAGIHLDIARLKATEAALRDAHRRKDEFLATLAHELRNPLAPIRHAVRILDAPGLDEAQKRWGRDVIARQVRRMALLLDDLLDVSRITRGQLALRREPSSLRSVVAAAVETAQPLVEAKRHALAVELPPGPLQLDVDPLRLSQAISNLLTNAAKYTDPGGHLELAVVRRPDGGLSLEVRDDGIGLDAATVPRLFEMFSQVQTALDRSEGGLGIGLALVRGLVELHGGTVDVRSDGPGRGSTFAIHLPAAVVLGARADEAGVASGPDATATGGCRVLVADDNRDAADALAIVLQLAGHEVHVAYDGRQALALAELHRPHAAVLDVGMPDLDGHEVARRLRAARAGAGLLLVAVTGWGQEEDKRRTRAAGFDHHLTKPVDPEALLALLAEGSAPDADRSRAAR